MQMTQTPRRRRYVRGDATVPLPDIVILPPARKGLPLVDGKGRKRSAAVVSRSTSRATVVLPSLCESRCTTLSPSPLHSRSTSASPAVLTSKRSSPGLLSVHEDEFNEEDANSLPPLKLQAVCSGAETTYGLAKLVDPMVWAREAANLDSAAKSAPLLPDIKVACLAFDTLSRIAKLLPAQRSILQALLRHLELSIFVGRGASKAMKSLDILSRPSTPALHIDLDVDSSSDDSEDESLVVAKRNAAMLPRSTRYPIGLPPSDDSQTSAEGVVGLRSSLTPSCLQNDARRSALFDLHVRFGGARDAGSLVQYAIHSEPPEMVHDAVADPSNIPRHAELFRCFNGIAQHVRDAGYDRNPPAWFQGHAPYFAVTRKQEQLIKKAKHKVAWMKDIFTGLEGQRKAADNLLSLASEMTSGGSLLKFCFALWRMDSQELHELDTQFSRLKEASTDPVFLAMCAWRFVTQKAIEARTMRERHDRQIEYEMMSVDMAHGLHTKDLLEYRLETNSVGVLHNTDIHKQVKGKRDELESKMNLMRPELLKPTVVNSLESLLSNAVNICRLQWIPCKRKFFAKDLSMLFMGSDEAALTVHGLPCTDLLIRWINYLLTVVKRQAAELLDLGLREAVSDYKSAWSQKDSPHFTDRCRQVRGAYLIENLGEDLRNGVVLTALYAMIKAFRNGHSHFDPSNLWPLDQRDEERRAEALCQCLQALAPTTAARCLLHKSDITQSNSGVLMPYLACVFLQEAPSPGMNNAASCRLTVKRLCHLLKHVRNEGHSKTRQTLRMGHDTAQNEILKRLSTRPLGHGLAPPIFWMDQADFLFASDDSSSEESDKDDSDQDSEPDQIEEVFDILEASSSTMAFCPFADPARLLRQNEDLSHLFDIPVKELLLRWLNLHTTEDAQVIKNFKSDLSNGFFLLRVISKIAPVVLRGSGIKVEDMKDNPEFCVQAVMECGPRAVESFNLTSEVLQEGREDFIACFVGKLFLVQPTLHPQTGSDMWKQLKVVEKFVREGYAIADATADKRYMDKFRAFCRDFHRNRARLDEALEKLIARDRLMQALLEHVRHFVDQTYSLRVHGIGLNGIGGRRVALRTNQFGGALGAVRTAMQDDSIFQCLKVSVWRTVFWSDPPETLQDHIRQTIQHHTKVLQLIFNTYSLPTSGMYRMPLDGLMKMYRSCRLRCPCVHMSPHVAEMLYFQILAEDLPPWKRTATKDQPDVVEGLSARGFVRWLLHAALHRHDQMSAQNENTLSFQENLEELMNRHFKPHGGHAGNDEFTHVSNLPEVRKVLQAREPTLRAVFEFYSEGESQQPEDETEDDDAPNDPCQVMSADGFGQIFVDAELLRGSLSQDAVSNIIANILAQAGGKVTKEANGEGAGERSSTFEAVGQIMQKQIRFDQLAKHLLDNMAEIKHAEDIREIVESGRLEKPLMTFFEFVDGMLAAALHINPNPFVNVELRVERFLTKSLYPALVSHWQDHPASKNNRLEKQRKEFISALTGGREAAQRNRKAMFRQRSLAIFQNRQAMRPQTSTKPDDSHARTNWQKASAVAASTYIASPSTKKDDSSSSPRVRPRSSMSTRESPFKALVRKARNKIL